MTPCTLYEAPATLPDPRSRHGRVHPLPAVMGLVTLALLMGRKSLKSVARFGRQHEAPLAHALGLRRGKTPSTSTLPRALRRFDAQQLEAALSRRIRARVGPGTFEQISLDGKALRGSRAGEVPGQHLAAAYAPAVEAVLAQIRVDSRTNEHKAALELLGILPLEGKVVVGDAMFCQRDRAERVVDSGGEYLPVVKDNQPGLEIDVRAGFAFEQAARGLAAATSPRGRPPGGPGGSGRHDAGGGPRPDREADAGGDAGPDGGAEVEGTQTGAADHTRADGEGREVGGGGVRDHESVDAAGERGDTSGHSPGPRAGRERVALRPGRDPGRGCLPGAIGHGSAGVGGPAERGHPLADQGRCREPPGSRRDPPTPSRRSQEAYRNPSM